MEVVVVIIIKAMLTDVNIVKAAIIDIEN